MAARNQPASHPARDIDHYAKGVLFHVTAGRLDISDERVRQIISRALRPIRIKL